MPKVIGLDSYGVPVLFKRHKTLYDIHQFGTLKAYNVGKRELHQLLDKPVVLIIGWTRLVDAFRLWLGSSRSVRLRQLSLAWYWAECAADAGKRLWFLDMQQYARRPVRCRPAGIVKDLMNGVYRTPNVGLHVTACPCGMWPECPTEHTSEELMRHSQSVQHAWDIAVKAGAPALMLPGIRLQDWV